MFQGIYLAIPRALKKHAGTESMYAMMYHKTLKSEGDPNLPEEDARVYGLQVLA